MNNLKSDAKCLTFLHSCLSMSFDFSQPLRSYCQRTKNTHYMDQAASRSFSPRPHPFDPQKRHTAPWDCRTSTQSWEPAVPTVGRGYTCSVLSRLGACRPTPAPVLREANLSLSCLQPGGITRHKWRQNLGYMFMYKYVSSILSQ